MNRTHLTLAGAIVGREPVLVELADGTDPAARYPDLAAGQRVTLLTPDGVRSAREITAPAGLLITCRVLGPVTLHVTGCARLAGAVAA